MKTHTTQRGSAHAIVIILLVLALSGTLGFVFYQNFIGKKDEAPKPAQTAKVETTKVERIAFNSTIYAFDYPKDWTVEATPVPGSTNGATVTKVYNPEKTVQATLNVSSGGIGGSCDVNDGLKISYYI